MQAIKLTLKAKRDLAKCFNLGSTFLPSMINKHPHGLQVFSFETKYLLNVFLSLICFHAPIYKIANNFSLVGSNSSLGMGIVPYSIATLDIIVVICNLSEDHSHHLC
jgi:hypothetical protein